MFPRKTVTAIGTVTLGRATEHANAALFVITVSGGGTKTIKPRIYHDTPGAASWDFTGYRKPHETSWTNPGVTPITADGVYVIEATGGIVALEVTAITGTTYIDGEPADG